MAKLLKLRRGTTSQHSSFTGAEGEVTVDTTKDTLVVHDGSTAGGTPLAKESALNAVNTDLVNDTTPQLGGNLDVNTKNILIGDSSDGATDDVIKFGAGTDLSIYSNGTEGIFGIPDGGTLKVKDGSNTMVTFAGTSNQIDFGVHCTFAGNSSNGSWDKSNSRFNANVQGNLTGNVTGDVTGNADTATKANAVQVDSTTNNSCFPMLASAGATGQKAVKSNSNLTFNASTGILTATGFVGNITGNVTGNASGSSGSCTGNAATATTATNVTVADESSDTTCNVLFTTAATGDLAPKSGTNLTFNSSTGELESTILKDSLGTVRMIPFASSSSQYTCAKADVGKAVEIDNGAIVNPNVFEAGDVITLINGTGSDMTITQGSSMVVRNSMDSGATGNRTLAARGMCTIYFKNHNNAYISGAGLS
tara:strand:+ start:971 stop:2236 length:1266 start_codon:yes stop_codon:yes gene_type:complete